MRNYSDDVEVEVLSDNKVVVYVPERDIARIIGKQGANINQIEEKIGMSIDVKELGDKSSRGGDKKENIIPHSVKMKSNSILFVMDIKMQHKDVDIYIGKEYVMSAKVGMAGSIKINKKNPMGKRLMNALHDRDEIFIYA
jgi:ATPase